MLLQFKRVLLILAIVVPLGAYHASAQESGHISGTVFNGSGIVATDAQVRLVGLGWLTDTSSEGTFLLRNVPIGSYLLEVSSNRWGRAIEPATVLVNQTTEVQIELLRQIDLEELVITAGPVALTRSEAVQPTDVATQQDLMEAEGVTIGDALGSRPGITSTFFGPGAGRPVIRGLGGSRVRILQQGMAVADASDISPDHAVSIETLSAHRIEVVRGPATLLYGSSAIGGVVNVLDGRVPNELPTSPVEGSVVARAGSVADERTGALDLGGGLGSWAWQANGLLRRMGDYTLPSGLVGEAEHEEGGSTDVLENSAVAVNHGSLGLSYVSKRGYIGMAYSAYGSDYGIPGHGHEAEGEEDEHPQNGEATATEGGTSIEMLQQALDIEGAWRMRRGPVNGMRMHVSISDYAHDEIEGKEVGTTFDNQKWEARIEADHSATENNTGVIGVQIDGRSLDLVGDEAYVPSTKTNSLAVFMLERFRFGKADIEAGIRYEHAGINPKADARSRTFGTVSVSGGINYTPREHLALALSASRSVKIPDAVELYANGPHVATRAFEIGNENLHVETALSLDASTHLHFDRFDATATAFYLRFSDFVFLQNTPDVEEAFRLFYVSQADAQFSGFEFLADTELLHMGDRHASLRLWSDYTHAVQLEDDEALPRIPPFRIGASLRFEQGPLYLGVSVTHVSDQSRVVAYEEETPGFQAIDASVRYRLFARSTAHEFGLQGHNLTNAVARMHTSFLKDIAPRPGRDFRLTYRFLF